MLRPYKRSTELTPKSQGEDSRVISGFDLTKIKYLFKVKIN